MRMRLSLSVVVSLAVGAAGATIAGRLEPLPGRGSWFTGLAGDWAVRIGETGYEIGNMPDQRGEFEVFRWKTVTKDGRVLGEAPEVVVGEVLRYAYEDPWIASETRHGQVLIDTSSGSVQLLGERGATIPSETRELFERAREPRPSHRDPLYALGMLCALAAGVTLWRRN